MGAFGETDYRSPFDIARDAVIALDEARRSYDTLNDSVSAWMGGNHTQQVADRLADASRVFDDAANTAATQVSLAEFSMGNLSSVEETAQYAVDVCSRLGDGKFDSYYGDMHKILAAEADIGHELDEAFGVNSSSSVSSQDDIALYVESLRESGRATQLARKYLNVESYERIYNDLSVIEDGLRAGQDMTKQIETFAPVWSEVTCFKASTLPSTERPGPALSEESITRMLSGKRGASIAQSFKSNACDFLVGSLPFKSRMVYVIDAASHGRAGEFSQSVSGWVDNEFKSRSSSYLVDKAAYDSAMSAEGIPGMSGYDIARQRDDARGALDMSYSALSSFVDEARSFMKQAPVYFHKGYEKSFEEKVAALDCGLSPVEEKESLRTASFAEQGLVNEASPETVSGKFDLQ